MIFESSDPKDPHTIVFQQELLIACADLVSSMVDLQKQKHYLVKVLQKPDAFDGILAIRLNWLTEAMQFLLDYFKESTKNGGGLTRLRRERKILDIASLLETSCPNAVAKQLGTLLSPLLLVDK